MHLSKVLLTASTFFTIASAATYNVTVGSGGLVFNPSSVSGVVAGDTILFQFPTSVSHSATQSSFDSPCSAMSSGIDSGLQTSSSSPPEYPAVIKDVSSPVWFYCKVPGHCTSGMVFAVNPTTSQSFDAFKAKAMGGSVPSGSLSATSPPKAASTSTSAATSTPSSSGSGSSGSGSSGSGYGSSGTKNTLQKMTMGVAGVLLIGLLA